MKIKKKVLCQYWLMYLVLLLNQSVALVKYETLLSCIAIFSSVFIAMKYCPNIFRKSSVIFPILCLTFSILLTRLTGGAAGISYLIVFISNVLVAVVAYSVDRANAAQRYVNVVTFFAIISIIMYILSILQPELVRALLGLSLSQNMIFSNGSGWTNAVTWDYYGHWFYSFGRETNRNCGLYTEPGLYIIVLISALVILLFQSKSIHKKTKSINRHIMVIIITLITAASASGFIMLIMVLLIFLLNKQDHQLKGRKWSIMKKIGILAVVISILASIDYNIRGMNSFLSQFFVSKISGLSFEGALAGSGESTGNARLIVILQGIRAFIRYPLGAGAVRMSNIATELQATYYSAGCGLFYYLGVLGIFGWTSILATFLIPISSKNISKKIKLLLLFIYIVYGLTQTNIWTATLLFVAYLFADQNHYNINKEHRVLER